jgi:hypothetical protein
VSCEVRIPFEKHVAWWAHDLDERDSADLEEHLFTCDACASVSEGIGRLVGGLRQAIPPVISQAHRARLVQGGVRVRTTPVSPGVPANAHFAPDVDLLVHELHGDFSNAERVDVEIVAPDGSLTVRLDYVPFDPESGAVLIACQKHYRLLYDEGGDPTFRVHVTRGGVALEPTSYVVVHEWE